MTTTFTLRFEGPDSCGECQRNGVPVCDHIGFNAEAWDHVRGAAVHVPGLDNAYQHVVRAIHLASDRKTLTFTVETERPAFRDLARHLSTRAEYRAKAAVRAVHHETGEVLEEGVYDAFLQPGSQVCIDRALYTVGCVEHPNRNEHGIAAGVDVQVAHLAPVETDTIRPAQ